LTVGIVTGLAAEAAILRRAADARRTSERPLIVCAGPGEAAARSAADTLARAGADGLMSFGLAGGLDPSLVPGTVIAATAVRSASGESFATDPAWHVRFLSLLAGRPRPLVTEIASAAVPVATIAAKRALFAATGAAGVDMESMGVARAARAAQIPFLAVRVICDPGMRPLPDAAVMAIGPGGRLRVGAVLGRLALRPVDLPALVRLVRDYRKAKARLRNVAAIGLPSFGLL
jgi:adenosylhomocysteine nucleosidase